MSQGYYRHSASEYYDRLAERCPEGITALSHDRMACANQRCLLALYACCSSMEERPTYYVWEMRVRSPPTAPGPSRTELNNWQLASPRYVYCMQLQYVYCSEYVKCGKYDT